MSRKIEQIGAPLVKHQLFDTVETAFEKITLNYIQQQLQKKRNVQIRLYYNEGHYDYSYQWINTASRVIFFILDPKNLLLFIHSFFSYSISYKFV